MIKNVRSFNFNGDEYESHLTAKQKQVIEKMIVNGWENAKSGRTEYVIGKHNETEYRLMIIKNETRTIGRGVQKFADRFVFEWISIAKEATVYPMVDTGEGAPQYAFDLAPETQLSLF